MLRSEITEFCLSISNLSFDIVELCSDIVELYSAEYCRAVFCSVIADLCSDITELRSDFAVLNSDILELGSDISAQCSELGRLLIINADTIFSSCKSDEERSL